MDAMRRLLQPSLRGRLLLAQLLMLVLLWCAMVVYFVYQSQHDQSELALDSRFEMILTAADQLADRPDAQAAVLTQIDRFQRITEGLESEPNLRLNLLVRRRDGQLLYASPGLPQDIATRTAGDIEKVSAGGRLWRARTLASPDTGISVTLAKPGEAINVLIPLGSHGFLVLPLLISLPFLALPAWLSLRLALRPWRRLAAEIATRGPQDLQPLAFRSRHRELRPLVDSLDALLARVRAGARREREFIADAAHELRTPLAAMRVNVEALRASPTLAADPAQRLLLDGTLRSGERASHVVAQLLALMRADAPPSPTGPQPLSLRSLAQDRLAAFAGLAARREAELALDAPQDVTVLGEAQGLTSLLDNLIDNALKYGPQGGSVTLRLLAHPDGGALLEVQDQGPGIAPALRARVFDRFFRADTTAQSGSGLGLSIVRAVADRHGATVQLTAGPGEQGLCVRVRFPD